MILRGDEDDARKTFRRIYKKATPEVIELKLRVARLYVEATTQMQRNLSFWNRTKKLWTHKPYRRALITVSGMQMFGMLSGFNSLLYYSGTLFGLFGFSNGAAAGLIPAGINALFVVSVLRSSFFPSCFFLLLCLPYTSNCLLYPSWPAHSPQFIGMSLVDRVGRRRFALIGCPIMISGLVWAIVSVYYMTAPTNHLLVAGADYDRRFAGSLIGAIAWFVVGYGISYSQLGWYQSEFLALEIRAVGSAIATTAVWVPNLIVSVSFLSQLENITPAGTYALYCAFVCCGYVFVIFCYPESSELSLPVPIPTRISTSFYRLTKPKRKPQAASLTPTPEGISIDEISRLYENDFGVKKSLEIRQEKELMQKRFRKQELEAGAVKAKERLPDIVEDEDQEAGPSRTRVGSVEDISIKKD